VQTAMTATATRATCASFSFRSRAAEKRKSPQNKAFYGQRTTYSGKAHCIKDRVLLDPACGSGSFLVGAYSYLLNYHLDYYTKDKNLKNALKNSKIYQVSDKNYKLAIEEKQKILVNNIYGVDIDSQAVEVTKLSLYLKLLENEGKEAEGFLFKHSDLKLLPTLDKNIKCGNSLIGSDFYNDKDLSLFGNDEMRKVNVFDWDKEFPEIFKNGGFDVCIGNPPYVRYENLSEELIIYSKTKYQCSQGFFDIFQLFLEKSFYIIRKDGKLGFIFPSLFLKGMSYKLSRKFFIENTYIDVIRNYGDDVFFNVKMPTFIFIVSKKNKMNERINFYIKKNTSFNCIQINQEKLINDNYIFESSDLASKISLDCIKLSDLIEITRGLEIGKNKAIIDSSEESIKIVFGKNISRYLINSLSYIHIKTLNKFNKNSDIFEYEKLVIRETGKRITATYDNTGLITNRSLYCIRSNMINLKYLLGIINSSLMQYYYVSQFKSDTDIFPKIRIGQVKDLPIKLSTNTSFHDKLVSLVEQMLETQKRFHNAKSESDKKFYIQKIDLIDKQIDKMVYELYDLTEDEIRIVEESS